MQEQSRSEAKYNRRDFGKLALASFLALNGIGLVAHKASADSHEASNSPELPSTRKVIIKGLSPGIAVTSVGPSYTALGIQVSQEGVPLVFEGVPCANDEAGALGGMYIYDVDDNLANVRGPEGKGGIYIPVYRADEGNDLILDFGIESPGLGFYQLNIHRMLDEVKDDGREPLVNKIRIAVIDNCIDEKEPTMADYISRGVINMSGHKDVSSAVVYAGDPHGISVCDVIARYGPSNVEIYPIAITSSSQPGNSTREQVEAAVRWCMNNNIRLINLSWYFSPNVKDIKYNEITSSLKELLNEANQKGTYIIGSAGNDGKDTDSTYYASGLLKNIRVGAMSNGGTVVDYSSNNPHVLGPTGIQAATLNIENGYPEKPQRRIFTGTSAASPAVLAVAANMAAYCPNAPMEVIIDALQKPECTTDIYGVNSETNIRDGQGIVDALKAYQYLKSCGY